MRILKLRFLNLNSLSGEWFIDFTHPAYLSDGIFAITGPTGSGKTTILDAICLALYGRTPRLEKIGKAGNEIMSRQSGECEAELIFETGSGRFRAHWSQRRSHKRADGALQADRHEIADDLKKKVLENSLSKTQLLIEKITGMNYDQFTRSMMLAQGAFAAFLSAKADERADLLEQITGADIYTDISSRTYRRYKDERQKLAALQENLANLGAPKENEKLLLQERQQLKEWAAALEKRLSATTAAVDWLTAVAALENKNLELKRAEEKFTQRSADFKPMKARLDSARKALRFNGIHSQLNLRRQTRAKAVQELKELQADRPRLELSHKAARSSVDQAIAASVMVEEKIEAVKPHLLKARALEVEIREAEKRVEPLNAKIKNIESELRELIDRTYPELDQAEISPAKTLALVKSETAAKKSLMESDQKSLTEILKGRDLAEWRDSLPGLVKRGEQLKRLAEEFERQVELKSELSLELKKQRQAETDLNKITDDLKNQNQLVAAVEKSVEHANARLIFQREFESLQDKRDLLKEGRACPLCGATSHPYVGQKNLPPDLVSEKEIDETKNRLALARKRQSDLVAQESALKQTIIKHEEAIKKADRESVKTNESLNESLSRLALNPPEDEALPAAVARLLAAAKTEIETTEHLVEKAGPLEKRISALAAETQKADLLIDEGGRLIKTAAECRAEIDVIRQRQMDLRKAIAELLQGRASAEALEKDLNQALAEAGKAFEKKSSELRDLETALGKNKALAAEAEERLKKLEIELNQAEADFTKEITGNGFSDEAAWSRAMMPEEELSRLEALEKELSEERAVLTARQMETSSALAVELAKKVTDKSQAEIQAENKELAESLKTAHSRLAVVEQHLLDCKQAADKHAQLNRQIEAQSRECLRWERLNELIGSADGKKYRVFAQGLTFEILVRQANRQLAELSNRYLLIPDQDQPLELKVIDNYQAGEIRSTKNLSGGESFIVSLALALGLSRMASRRVRVDSLFLDEGFGTLDEEALETALGALAGLRQGGKLIGVISHVPALTARVSTQIKVRPANGPHSRLSGPGVKAGPRLDL